MSTDGLLIEIDAEAWTIWQCNRPLHEAFGRRHDVAASCDITPLQLQHAKVRQRDLSRVMVNPKDEGFAGLGEIA